MSFRWPLDGRCCTHDASFRDVGAPDATALRHLAAEQQVRASRIEQTSCSELMLSMHEQSEGRARTFCTTPGNAGSRADSPGSHTLSGPSSSCYADYGCTSRQKRCSLATPPQTIICSGRPIRISDTGLPCGPSSRQSRVCSCTGCSPALSAVVVGQHLMHLHQHAVARRRWAADLNHVCRPCPRRVCGATRNRLFFLHSSALALGVS